MDDWRDQLARRWAQINKSRRENRDGPTVAKQANEGTSITSPKRRVTEINLGVDFGTSFTKVSYRILGRDIVGFVPFGASAPDGESTMTPSLVWIDTVGHLYSAFDKRPAEAVEIRYFKMHLAGRGIGDPYKPSLDLGIPVYRLISAFFLSKVLRKVKDEVTKLENIPEDSVVWSGNIGIPIGYVESEAKPRFEEVARVAVDLCDTHRFDAAPTLDEVEREYRACLEKPSSASADYVVMSELEAEIIGLMCDPSTKDGIYALFDVGGGTVDGAAFHFKREKGEPRVNILTALVAPLGFAAAAAEAHREIALACVEQAFRNGENELLLDTGSLKSSMHRHVSSVIVIAKRRSDINWKERMEELPVFISGGGRHSAWHRASIEETYGCNQHGKAGIPVYSCRELPVPEEPGITVRYNGASDHGRYIVAYGLSIPNGTYAPPIGFPRHNPEIEYKKFDTSAILETRMYDLYGEL